MSIEMQSASQIEAAHDEGKSIVIEGDGSVIVDESTGEIIEGKSIDSKQIEQDKPDIKAEDIQAKPSSEPSHEEKEAIRQQLIAEAQQDKPQRRKSYDLE